jgi:hypothetical protein|tara:strand:- start:9037 stop:10368 length:1332 start_codon:yes stop_codon:yes gene_type:complete
MASTYTPLGVELMATGENAGTWGTKTNTNLNIIEQIAGGYAVQTLNAAGGGANTTALAVSDGSTGATLATRIIILGAESPQAITGAKIVTFPNDVENFYLIKNSTSGAYTVQLKTATGSGGTVTYSTTDKGWKIIYIDGAGSNPSVVDTGFSTTAGDVTLTGTQTLTNKTLTSPAIGTSILDTNGNELIKITATGSAENEFTVAAGASGNGPTLSSTGSSDSNIDINITPAGTGDVVLGADTVKVGDAAAAAVLTSNGAGTLTVTTGGTTDLVLSTNSGTNSGTFTITDAANGAMTMAPNGYGKFTIDGLGAIESVAEKVTIDATAATGTINYDATTQAVWYFTSDASGDWTINLRGDGSNTMNTIMATGESLTLCHLVTIGSSEYRNTVVQVDGTTSGVTTEWQGGAAPSEGNASSVDSYVYTVIKTGASAYTVFASMTQYA